MPTKRIPPNAFDVIRQFRLFALLLFISFTIVLAPSAFAATVTTDQPDYPPGDSVVITGSGFWGSEMVTLQVTHYDGTPTTGLGHTPWDVIANAIGDFETYWLIPEDDNLDETLMVTAYGQSSGIYAYTLFTDHNTRLNLLTAIPDTLCPGSTFQVCVQLTQACGGQVYNPLPNRPIYFFVNPGNCGVDVGQNADDTVLTDANGVACATLTIPIGTGTHAIRAKFLGEDKPGSSDPPNGVCEPNQRVQLSAANECETFKVHPNACNQPPVATCPGNSTIFLCSLQQVCITGFSCSDPDGNLSSCTVSLGTLSGNQVCFTPTGEGNYTIRLIATDSQGLADTCETVVTIVLNDPPVAVCPGDMTRFVCDLSQLCITGFSYSDPNNNIASVTVTGGTLSGNQVCFTPVEGVNTITMIVTDSCGKADTCVTNVTVSLNDPPVAVCPGDMTRFVCDLSQLCITGFSYSDPNNNIASVAVTGGTLSGNQVCFTPVEGINTITMIVTDSCGKADTCVTNVTVSLNDPPVAVCPGNQTRFVCDLSQLCITGFSYSDPNNNIASVTVTGGTLSGNQVCFTPVEGVNTITMIVTDSCGKADTCVTNVTVSLNDPPVAVCPGDMTRFVCDLSQLCITGFSYSDPNNNIASVAVTGGTLSGNQVCFTPVEGINTITMIVTDSCGKADTCVTNVTVSLNDTPVAVCPGNQTRFVCDLSQLCITGFSYSDPNNNIASVAVTGGTLSGNQVCFTPVEGINTITMIVTDSCGKADTCVTNVTVSLNDPPVAVCPGNQTRFVCDLSQLCITGFSYSDPNNNIASVAVTGGTLSGNQVCFTPVVGNNLIRVIVTDSCGLADTCETTVTVAMNRPPVATCPGNQTRFVCNLNQLCLEGFSYSDPDNNIASVQVVGGTLSGNQVCFTPVEGANTLRLIVTDSCGVADTCETVVTVNLNDAPVAVCPGNSSMFVCNLNQTCLPGFSWSDPNNNIASVTAVGGTLSGNQVCFTPVAGANSLKLIVTDSCGIADTCETIVTVALNQPPVANCPGNQTRFVCNLSQLCISGFSYSDPNNNIASVTVTGGTLSGNQVCFTPVVGANSIKLIVTDSCGVADTCETVVTVALNQPPVANCPGNQTRFVCNLGQLCVSGFSWSDPNNNIASVTVTGGTLSGNQVCFTPVVGANSIKLIVTDSCGLADTCETIVTVALNQPPVANCPGNQTRFVCNLSQLCITGFSYSDPNNNIATVAVVGGTLSGNQVCFTPVAGPNSLKLIVTDSCGLADTCETIVTVTVNAPPVATCPGNETRQVCDLSQICLSGFSASDPNSNLASVTVTGGVLNGNTVCVTPVAGANTIRLIATDSCGAADTCVTVLTVNLNSPPVVSCPANVAIDLFSLSEVCLPGFTASDPDGNLINVVVTGGTLSNDTVCFNPVEGLNIITITATDACGASSSCTTEVYVNLISTCPIVKIEKTHNTLQGHYQDVAITIEDASYDMGGFDFLIAYDASALTFVQATPGEVLTDCAWEYFTYRFGPFGNCGTGCPSGMIRIVALAETNNGPVSPDCFGPSDGSLHTLAILRFLVSNDRTLECQYVPIRFFWLDCGDNTIASVTGDTTFLDSKIFEFSGGLLWDEIDNVSFPEDDRIAYIGAPDYPCMIGEKRVPIRCIEFWNGGIDIICADSIDARGDVNLNGIPNEIGDAVTFTNYFIAGLAAFTVSIEGQIAATELNGDGVVLSVADLVYLIRVVIGDAQPLAKLTPFAESVSVRYNGSIVSVDTELGAALLVFAGDIPVTLGSGAYGMDIKTGLVDGNTHVLIYSLDRGRIFSGEILHANGALLNFEGSDYYGNAYRVVMNPDRFAVSNFPNPFNAQTVIRLELPSATDYEVTIYNISGQKVHGWSGYSEAGILELNWTADVASGIYFYKVQAGAYGVTRKMVLLK